MKKKVRLGGHLFEMRNMRGEPCPHIVDRVVPCDEVGWCLGCPVYLVSFQKRFCDRCNEKGACGKQKTNIYGCQAQVDSRIWHLLHLGVRNGGV